MSEYSLGTAELGTSVSMDGLSKGIDAAEGKTKSGFLNIGGILNAALGGVLASVGTSLASAFGGFLSGGIDDAREAAKLMAQTETVIKSTGGAAEKSASQVADLASSLSAAGGKSLFGDDQVQVAENLLLTFTNIKGEVFNAATAISVDMAQALGGEPQSQAIALGKALNDPIQGVTALTRVGVTFTDEQKAQIQTMQDAGNMAGAQQIILAELNKEFGGSAEAAAKADGGTAQFKDQLGELGEGLGSMVLPLLNQFVQFAISNLMPALSVAVEWLGANLPGAIAVLQGIFGTLFTAVGPILTELGQDLPTVIGVLMGVFGALGGVLTQSGDSTNQLGGIWVALQGTFNAIVPPIRDLVMAVFGIIGAFLHDHGDDIRSFLQTTWSQIAEIIGLAAELVKAIVVPIFTFIAGFLRDHGAEIQTVISNTWTIIKSVIDIALTLIKGIIRVALDIIHGDWSGAWTDIQAMFSRVWDDIKAIAGAAVSTVETILGGAWNTIRGAASSAWESIKGAVAGTIDSLIATIQRLPSQVAGVGAAVVNAIWDGIRGRWDQLVAWFNDRLAELRSLLPFSEPRDRSSPLYGLGRSGEAIVRTIQQGINAAAPLQIGQLAAIPIPAFSNPDVYNLPATAGTTNVNISLDDRGLGLLKQLIRVEVQDELHGLGRSLDTRMRTR
jgi:hypothetical protein